MVELAVMAIIGFAIAIIARSRLGRAFGEGFQGQHRGVALSGTLWPRHHLRNALDGLGDAGARSERRLVASIPALLVQRAAASRVAAEYGFTPDVLLGIMSVESAGNEHALGDGGHSHGLMQVHDKYHPEKVARWRVGGQTAEGNIRMGAQVLRENVDALRRLYPRMDDADLLRAAVAAYNTGVGNVSKMIREGRDVDTTTASGYYSLDVLHRAALLRTRDDARGG